jgi:hypothetical protein
MKNLLGQEIKVGDLIFDYSPTHNCCALGHVTRLTKTMVEAKFAWSRDTGRKIKIKYALKMSIDDVNKYIDNLEDEVFKKNNQLILKEWYENMK